MNLVNHAEDILNIYNYYSGAIMVNKNGIIEYYYNTKPNVNTLTEDEILGKTIFEVYPGLTEKTSTLMEVIRTGKEIRNQTQQLSNYKGEKYSAAFNTFPVLEKGKVIGAIEVFVYFDEDQNISVDREGVKKPVFNREKDNIIYESQSMKHLMEQVVKVSMTDSPVMIYGETGTGKELIAKAIHRNSSRSDKPYLAQNCAAIPENLLESLLFGTVKGGFTDAMNKVGLFEAANGGTIFLDEINSMNINVQSKILKVVEKQRVRRIGATEEIPINVRIITAVNENPKKAVELGLLRSDLYYRLRVVQLDIEPLRNRREDITVLTSHYINYFNKLMGMKIEGVSKDVERIFMTYTWPGNIRELRNLIESGFNFCEGNVIEVSDLDFEESGFSFKEPLTSKSYRGLKESVHNFENYIIAQAIKENENIISTAEQLGISRQTLSKRLKEEGIPCKN